MPRRRARAATPAIDERVSETDFDDVENDKENELDENAFSHAALDFAPVHRSSSVLVLRTPLTHSRTSHETPLRDITDQFFHPPSPSPVKSKRSAPYSIEPPRRPKKPKSFAYPADPPNWIYSRSSSSLPPSSPFPTSTANAHFTDRSAAAAPTTTARYEYNLGSPSKASDSDPFGFVAVERALKAKRTTPTEPPRKSTLHVSSIKSPPRSTVLPSAPSHTYLSSFASFSQPDAPVATNNEDIEGLYTDEPVAGPSHVPVPVAPLLLMNSDQPLAEINATRSQPTFADPLRTPRKRKRRPSPTPNKGLDSDSEGTDVPSSPSPIKISVSLNSHRARTSRPSHSPVLKLTRSQTRAAGATNAPTAHAPRTKRIKTSYQDIPTPSSTPRSPASRQSTVPPTPIPPRRSKRQAAVGARAKLRGTTSDIENEDGDGRMKLRSRSAKMNTEVKTTKPTTRAKHPPSKSKTPTKTQKATTAKPARGRPKGKASAKDAKGKGKTRPLKSVLDLSDDTREIYEKERRERLEYFKRLEGYQMQKENVYVV
ncbi:hypothetical protein JVU11DRAFT_7445 [Chiua virens]|nr:hypothetical protein JVU11DRAFT_7445 [Chiua virens]